MLQSCDSLCLLFKGLKGKNESTGTYVATLTWTRVKMTVQLGTLHFESGGHHH